MTISHQTVAPLPVLSNKNGAAPSQDLVFQWKDNGHFEVKDLKAGKPVAHGVHPGNNGVEIKFFDGKGGFNAIVSTEKARYLLMPGARFQKNGTDLQLASSGHQPAAISEVRLPNPTAPQNLTTVGMILGAGLSSRIEPAPMEGLRSKPDFEIGRNNHTIIARLANHLKQHGLQNVMVNTYFHPESVEKGLNQTVEPGKFNMHFIREEKPSGSAGGLLKAWLDPKLRPMLQGQHVVVVQGDSVTNLDISEAIRTHAAKNAAVTIGGYPVPDSDLDKFGIMVTDHEDGQSGNITKFVEKPALRPGGVEEVGKSRLANTGVYVFAPEVLPLLEEAKAASEKRDASMNAGLDYALDVFPTVQKALTEGRLQKDGKPMAFYAKELKGYWNDVGNLGHYFQVLEDLSQGKDGQQHDMKDFYENGKVYWNNSFEQAQQDKAQIEGNAIILPAKKG